jgi:hypothetical protein
MMRWWGTVLQRRALSVAAGVVLGGITSLARAAEVTWRAPPECSESHGTREEAERLLGRPLRSIDSVDFEVLIEEGPGGPWSLTLVTIERKDGVRRERVLQGASCDEVAAAAAVALAMVIDAGQGKTEGETSPAREPVATKPSDAA